jgi:hypothetical protein
VRTQRQHTQGLRPIPRAHIRRRPILRPLRIPKLRITRPLHILKQNITRPLHILELSTTRPLPIPRLSIIRLRTHQQRITRLRTTPPPTKLQKNLLAEARRRRKRVKDWV